MNFQKQYIFLSLIHILDLEKEMIYTKELNNINRATTITWTNDGDMILAAPQNLSLIHI